MVLGCYRFGLGDNRVELASPYLPEVMTKICLYHTFTHYLQVSSSLFSMHPTMNTNPRTSNHSLQRTAEEALIHDFDHVSIHPETQPDSYCLVVKILTPETPKPEWIGNAMKDAWIALYLASLYDSITPLTRIRALLDTTKPLFCGMNIYFRKLSITKWLKFQYEGIQNYCYHCGKLNHTFNKCENFLDCDTHAHPPSLNYKDVLTARAKTFYKKSIFELSNSTPFEEISSLNNPPNASPYPPASVFNTVTFPIKSNPIMTSTVLTSTSKGKEPMHPECTRVSSETPPEPIRLRNCVAPLTIFGSKRTYTRQSNQVGTLIISSLSNFPGTSICFSPRSLNTLAHNISHRALGTDEEVIVEQQHLDTTTSDLTFNKSTYIIL
ncbi:hypothetical protein G4B88_009470 [Cannabis sativa]|uniref:Zinc knuckle CX2CX4HX4C domain-containing protein n=1 Tax=Cannabis sativa TaxID=3483 RepID=A0A7J6EWY3_CANSA|nr:hypothetical protein G4B88_009470 [Cannabis sativa]